MKKVFGIILVLTSFMVVNNAVARDDHHMFSLEEAINSPEAKSHLDPDIKLYFGNQRHPKVVTDFGEWKTNKKQTVLASLIKPPANGS